MTVSDWITTRSPRPPDALLARVVGVLGTDGARPADETANVCVAAAARQLQSLVDAGRFERESAIDLLAVDALVTFAFEHASTAARADLERLSGEAIMRLGALTPSS